MTPTVSELAQAMAEAIARVAAIITNAQATQTELDAAKKAIQDATAKLNEIAIDAQPAKPDPDPQQV